MPRSIPQGTGGPPAELPRPKCHWCQGGGTLLQRLDFVIFSPHDSPVSPRASISAELVTEPVRRGETTNHPPGVQTLARTGCGQKPLLLVS